MIPTLDLFCGAGGLSLGFTAAGFETVAAVECDAPSVATFSHHSPKAEMHACDVAEVDFRRYAGKVELVIGGPPCQPFSSGGLRRADEDHRDMVPEFVRAVREVRPVAFVMENVPGLAAGDRKPYLLGLLARLQTLGYQVVWDILSAEEYGAPQRRRRLFIVGIQDRRYAFPKPTHGTRKKPVLTVADVITMEPRGEPNPSKVFYAKRVDLRPSPYHGLLFNGGGRPLDFARPSPTIISSIGGNKTPFVDTLGLVPGYHAYLLAGGTPKHGEVPGCRRLTVRECAALQTFPESLVFSGPTSAQYRQIGNAVPPSLARVVADALNWTLQSGSQVDLCRAAEQTSFAVNQLWGDEWASKERSGTQQ